MKKSHCLFSLAAGLAVCASASAQIVAFDFGAVDADTTVNSPAGSVAGNSFIKVNGVATVEVLDSVFGDLNLNLSRGLNNVDDLSVLWTTTATAVNSVAPPAGSVLAQSPGVYGDYVRNGDVGRTVGLRLNGLDAGTYEIFATLTAPAAQTGRNAAIGVFSGAMPNSTLISDLNQVSVASWDNYNASLTTWVPSTSADPLWNVLRAVVTVSGPTDWIVLHLENGTSGNQMGISSLQVIPEPSTYAALIGLLALGLVAWRRRR